MSDDQQTPIYHHLRPTEAVDAQTLRHMVADQIENHPETYDQGEWGYDYDGTGNPALDCGAPCCVAGWTCRLSGVGTFGLDEWDAARVLLWIPGKPTPSFRSDTTKEEVLEALRA